MSATPLNQNQNHILPSIQQVVPGAGVSIVLKIDQPTGRQVQGIIAEVLTSGNHPRGIKVRLRDGRVGRVQQMVTDEEAQAGSQGLSGLGRNGESLGGSARSEGRISARYADVREDGYEPPPSNTFSLGDFLPESDSDEELLLQDNGTSTLPSVAAPSVCPVCGEFEGDEIAVAHHVNTHFE